MQDGEVGLGVDGVGRWAGGVSLLQRAVTIARKAGATSAELLVVADREGYDCAQFADLLAKEESAALLADARRYQLGGPHPEERE